MKRTFVPEVFGDNAMSINEAESGRGVLQIDNVPCADPALVKRAMKLIEVMFNYESFPSQNEVMGTTHDHEIVVLEFKTPEAAKKFHEFATGGENEAS